MVDRLFKKYTNVILLILFLLILSCDSSSITGLGEGKEKLLIIKESDHYSEIGTMNPDGSGYRKLFGYSTNRPNRSIDYAELSPDKEKIVFSGGPGEALHDHNVWLTDIDGNVIERLAYYGRRPMWTGEGKKIYYTRYRNSTTYLSDVYVYDFDKNLKVDIPPGQACNGYDYCNYFYGVSDVFPHNSTTLIVLEYFEYVRESTLFMGDMNYFTFNSLSNNKSYITDGSILGEGVLQISPTDPVIVFTSIDTLYGNFSSFNIANLDGTDKRELESLDEKYYHASFAWSPNGKKIAVSKQNYFNKDKPLSNIYILDPATGEEDQITFEEDRSTIWYVMQWFTNE